MLNGLFILHDEAYRKIYTPEVRQEIGKHVHISGPQLNARTIRDHLALLEGVEVIFSGWGGPKLDATFLEAAPRLKAVFYGAGSVKSMVTDAFWDRNIPITSAYAANAVPVAEYVLSQILFLLRGGWLLAQRVKQDRHYGAMREWGEELPGTCGSTVGIVSLGMIGRRVRELLRPFELHVLAYDPYVSREQGEALGVEMCSLEELFRRSDVITLHTPWLKETEGMITGEHFALMKRRASFINTARGAIVREQEMIEALRKRPDLQAVLDVTYPEPPEPDSPLFTLPNVVLTPHIAGSMTVNECQRMGMYMAEELRRFVAGQPLQWEVSRERAAMMA